MNVTNIDNSQRATLLFDENQSVGCKRSGVLVELAEEKESVLRLVTFYRFCL